MSSLDPGDRPPAQDPAPVVHGDTTAPPGGPGLPPDAPPKHRNAWKWVSAALVLVAAGLLVWALTTQSDLDQAQNDVAQLESQAAAAKDTGGDAVAAAQDAYADITQQLGSTNDDLAEVEQKLAQTPPTPRPVSPPTAPRPTHPRSGR